MSIMQKLALMTACSMLISNICYVPWVGAADNEIHGNVSFPVSGMTIISAEKKEMVIQNFLHKEKVQV